MKSSRMYHVLSCFLLSFSDQEPPYSMITLHEMAETGKTLKHISIAVNARMR